MPTFYDTVFVTAAEQGCVISSSARFQRILRAVKCHCRNADWRRLVKATFQRRQSRVALRRTEADPSRQGTFFGVTTIVAAGLVPDHRRATALAMAFAGVNVANVLGVPGGAAIGNAFGWRATFWAIAGLGLISALATAILLPLNLGQDESKASLRREFIALGRQKVYLSFLMIVLMCVASLSLFTYIAPLLINVTGVSREAVPWLLLVFGGGAILGGLGGGRLADWKLMPSVIAVFAAQVIVFGVLLFASRALVPMAVTMFVWGAVTMAPGAALAARILKGAREAPNLASTISPSAFNSATMNGTRWAMRPAMKATSRERRSSLATMTGHFPARPAANAAASWGRQSRASAPFPDSASTNSAVSS